MTLEAVLASFHLLAVLTLVVFLTSQAALCRVEWINPAVLARLPRLSLLVGVVLALVLITGLMRVFLGIKGASWYAPQPMLHLKFGLLAFMGLLSVPTTRAFKRWHREQALTGAVPDDAEIRRVHRLVMIQSHVLPVVAVLAVFWARGW
jgi:putative membrane protein